MRAWIGLGRQRGSPNDSSVNDLATSKPTSMPTRSISSNGPIRKPPAMRQMRSICSCGGDPLPEQAQRLAGERAPAAVDEEAGAVGGQDHALAHRLAGRAGQLERRGRAVWSARITSSSSISGGGLKKCMPTTFSGCSATPASEVTGIEQVLVASTASGPQTRDSSREQLALELRPLRAPPRSRGRSRPGPRAPAAVSSSPAALGVDAALVGPALEARRARAARRPRAPPAAGRAARVRKPAAQPSCAMPGAHRAGADDPEDHRPRNSGGRFSTNAVMPSTRSSVAIASSNRRRSVSSPAAQRASRPRPAPPACRAAPRAAAGWPPRCASSSAASSQPFARRHLVDDPEPVRLRGVDPAARSAPAPSRAACPSRGRAAGCRRRRG